jgi:hypothetical protein
MYEKEKSWIEEFGTSSPNLQNPKYIEGQSTSHGHMNISSFFPFLH